jgi:hypothetical protein
MTKFVFQSIRDDGRSRPRYTYRTVKAKDLNDAWKKIEAIWNDGRPITLER